MEWLICMLNNFYNKSSSKICVLRIMDLSVFSFQLANTSVITNFTVNKILKRILYVFNSDIFYLANGIYKSINNNFDNYVD